MLQRLARTCFRRRWIVLGVWVAVLIGLNVLANGVIGSNFRTDFKLPATESRTVFEMLQKANPDRSGATSQIVFQDASPARARPRCSRRWTACSSRSTS